MSDIRTRLRTALAARAELIQPSSDGLTRIEEKLMSESSPSGNPESARMSTNQKWILGVLSGAAAILLVVVGFVVVDDDGDDADIAAGSTTSTTSEAPPESTSSSSSTTSEATTTTAPFAPEVDPFGVAYPSPTTSQRFESPESAATSYAREVLGFTELVMGEFMEGDSRSGEVPISDREDGPETTVLVRLMDDDTWYVLGSVTDDIVVDTPAAGDPIASPFATDGEALAFEGTVDVFVRTQADPMPIGEGFVMGNGVPPAGPFEGSIEFTPPSDQTPATGTPGIVVYRELSAEDGHVTKATSFPVRLLPDA